MLTVAIYWITMLVLVAISTHRTDGHLVYPLDDAYVHMAIAKNVAQTETLVKDGQTLVLGGIYTIEKTQRQTRVPYLHRIPVIGNLFKQTEVTDSRKELLVFVTPRIVRVPEMAAN